MKAYLCDMCTKVINPDTKDSMLYYVLIEPAEEFVAEKAIEKATLLELEHVCLQCAGEIREAVRKIKTKVRKPKL